MHYDMADANDHFDCQVSASGMRNICTDYTHTTIHILYMCKCFQFPNNYFIL